ncbi:MAG: hypothetical protein HY661_06105 [Betaproteobacteria bacterium]|nr:hypothetical protein [Betaproteobacteria bacterium]
MRNVIFMMLLAVVSNSAAAEWSLVRQNAFDGDYIDRVSIRRDGETAYMSSLVNFDRARALGNGQRYLSMQLSRKYDCKDPKSRIIQVSWYAETMGLGPMIAKDDYPYRWDLYEASVPTQLLWKIACGK